jgi:hypothetical protein
VTLSLNLMKSDAEDGLVGKELQWRIKDKHKIDVNYKRVYAGMLLAQTQLFGSWDRSFNNLYRFKEEVERCCPGSFVVIDHHTVAEKIRFNRLFFALKPCIDGFLKGCRPYLAVDNTFLSGKFRGQLACAVAVDGHNWMYHVGFGVIDSETNENWIWFMERLRLTPTGARQMEHPFRHLASISGLAVHAYAIRFQ